MCLRDICGRRFRVKGSPTAAVRYYDKFVKVDGVWLFAERLLYVDWIEERILS